LGYHDGWREARSEKEEGRRKKEEGKTILEKQLNFG